MLSEGQQRFFLFFFLSKSYLPLMDDTWILHFLAYSLVKQEAM